MSVEEELKKDHSEMQAVVDSKQKIIDAQVDTISLSLQYLGLLISLKSSYIAPSGGRMINVV